VGEGKPVGESKPKDLETIMHWKLQEGRGEGIEEREGLGERAGETSEDQRS